MKILKQPYPFLYESREKLKVALLDGSVVFLLLYTFRPFGIDRVPVGNPDIFIAGYCIVTFVIVAGILFTLPFLFPSFFEEKNWTAGRNILFTTLVIFIIGIANLYYTHLFAGIQITLRTFLNFQFFTFSISFLIAAISTFLKQYITNQSNSKQAEELTQCISKEENRKEENLHTIYAENQKDFIQFSENDLLFILSAENYSEFHLIRNDNIEKTLLRTSLTRVEEQMKDDTFFRCHRSYIVNLRKIIKVSGNSQGYQLHLKELSQTIPVSRKYGSSLSKRIRQTEQSVE